MTLERLESEMPIAEMWLWAGLNEWQAKQQEKSG